MLIHIANVLGAAQLERVQHLLAEAPFQDGKLSAGAVALRVKHNQEVIGRAGQMDELNRIVMGNLVRHPAYKKAALPYRTALPFYVRYTQDMRYGDHIDDPIMGEGERYRADIAVTVFLNPSDAYDGGELIIQSSFGEQRIKYPAGDAVLYPASSRHQVSPVTSGERLVAVTWIQSLIRDPLKRELLYELGKARDKLLGKTPDAPEARQVDFVYVNLIRRWAEF